MTNSLKKLYRSRKDRIVAGVGGGLGEYFEIDSTIIRIIFILLALGHGAGLLIYIFLIFVIPNEGEKEPGELADTIKSGADEVAQEMKHLAQEVGEQAKSLAHEMKSRGHHHDARNILGFILVVIGLIMLANAVLPIPWFHWNLFWAGLIILFGFYLIFKKDFPHHGK